VVSGCSIARGISPGGRWSLGWAIAPATVRRKEDCRSRATANRGEKKLGEI